MGYLVTVETYRTTTDDWVTDPVTVSARIEQAQELLEDALERPLEAIERTERMYPTRDGYLWPRATPILDAPENYTIDGAGLFGVFPLPTFDIIAPTVPYVSVVYTGGWAERTSDPAATNRLPKVIESDLCWAAKALGDAFAPAQFPPGAVSVTLGDASVSFGPNGAPGPAAGEPQWSKATLRYRYRVIGMTQACSR